MILSVNRSYQPITGHFPFLSKDRLTATTDSLDITGKVLSGSIRLKSMH
ncbi:conserved hypothetical protein [Oenococcus oeni]|nr:conserved hypothetical protein [Oenococcus oeni]